MKRASLLLIVVALLTAGVASGQQQQQPPPPAQKTPPPAAKDAPKPAPRKRLVVNLSGFEMSDPSQVRSQRAMLGATRGGSSQAPVLLAPYLAKFYGASPLFAWVDRSHSEGFEIVLRDDDDNEVLRRQVSTCEFRLDSASLRWQPGKTYYWSVRSYPPLMDSNFSDVAGFVVVPESERRQIEKELAALPQADAYRAATARARVFVEHRLWYDTVGAYTDLIKQHPDRAELYEQRATIYDQIEATKAQAEADFARADDLAKTPEK